MTLSLTFSQSIFEQNVSVQLNYCDFQRFLLFRNKARNAGRSGKNAGMREISQNAGFPARLRDGWHLCVHPTNNVTRTSVLQADREMTRIANKSANSTPEVGADLRRRHFRPDALVPCWWPDDILTTTGAQLLLSDQKRHQAALYVKLKIDRWRTLVQRKEAELNVR